jgi:hypothetical protein
MKKLVRSVAIAAAIVAPAIALAAPAAQAANADGAVITGAGQILPGLTATPRQQAVNFNGTATVAGTHGVLTTYGCAFAGTDLEGSYAEGAGTVAGTCGPIGLNLCVFVRVAAVVPVVCADTSGPDKFAGGAFVFVPDQTPSAGNPTPPVTSYTLAGAAIYADAP